MALNSLADTSLREDLGIMFDAKGLSIPWRILHQLELLLAWEFISLNSLADTSLLRLSQRRRVTILSQFLGGYFLSSGLIRLMALTLNSLADTSEGLYNCYIRFGGIYVYPSVELKDSILGKNVDQRT